MLTSHLDLVCSRLSSNYKLFQTKAQKCEVSALYFLLLVTSLFKSKLLTSHNAAGTAAISGMRLQPQASKLITSTPQNSQISTSSRLRAQEKPKRNLHNHHKQSV